MTNRWIYNSRHVQEEITGQDFLAAQSTLIACGPPKLRQAAARDTSQAASLSTVVNSSGELTGPVAGTSRVTLGSSTVFAWPLGITENIGIGQNKQINRLFEIGSRMSYFIVGRTVSSVSLARTMYDGPNLLRALYAYFPAREMPKSGAADLLSLSGSQFKTLRRVAGYGDFFLNLDSDLFDKPFGLMLIFLDSSEEPYGACYIEDAHIQNHQFGISSQANIIGEGVTIQYDQLVPVNIGAKNFKDKVAETGSVNFVS